MNLTKFFTVSACLILALILTGCGNEPAKFADVDAKRLLNASQTPEEWLTYGGTYDEQRHSALKRLILTMLTN